MPMELLHRKIRTGILGLVDFFYPPFSRFMPLQTYRYAACGGSNTALNIFIFFCCPQFRFAEQGFKFGQHCHQFTRCGIFNGFLHYFSYWLLPKYVCGFPGVLFAKENSVSALFCRGPCLHFSKLCFAQAFCGPLGMVSHTIPYGDNRDCCGL